ncbi:MAG: glutamate synthase-related protein, partial [bacterium]|nr:glutamate synthase-related protein [bacterium]
RHLCSIIALTDEAVETHEVASLFAFGANAVVPYLGYDIIRKIAQEHNFDAITAIKNYRSKLEDGILKVMSKMGISVLESYIGSMLMDAVGISRGVIERFFTNSNSKISGVGLEKIADDVLTRHKEAYTKEIIVEHGGEFVYRTNGEYHAFNPEVVKALQNAAIQGTLEAYKIFDNLIHNRPLAAFRDLFEFKKGNPIPIEEVEPLNEILKRFVISGMSFGALSIETHSLLAQAANELGAKSNSGEGGEIPERFGTIRNSKIKQVASGRFGVTTEYLLSAQEIEIKMAQGSKPGEGGHLPGEKVTEEIAKARKSQIGVSLISPPPHHDIYSIEDLAQLIYDLKRVNPQAKVAVKLVSGRGVGTIACGVAKAFADTIQISGSEGGTGASPLSSIKNAGLPLEFGLCETQRALVVNNLRKMVRLRVDGGIKCGKDVVLLAMLGAEEFGFGTAALVAAGCLMARQCHRNTCPVGVATQNPELRKKFPNKVERVKNYLTLVAQEVREILAELGFKKLEDIIGRSELIKVKDEYQNMFDYGSLILQSHTDIPHSSKLERNEPEHVSKLDEVLLNDLIKTLDSNTQIEIYSEIKNTDRTIGAYLSGQIIKKNKDFSGKIKINFKGYAGQSFGAFLVKGVEFSLNGIANDYVGKSLSGGIISIKLNETEDFVLAGNACLYGATDGKLFIRGFVGERFAVRNSGAISVVHGCADHGCEYMTGGAIVVLKKIGKNFASGMTGGVAYILAKKEDIEKNLNPYYTQATNIEDDDYNFLKTILNEFIEKTNSKYALEALKNIESFFKIIPKETVLKKLKT